MIGIILGFTGLVLAGVTAVFYAAAHAPVGFENEKGFHLAPEPAEAPKDIPAALPVYTR